jgi:hypothetical protein
MLLLRYLMELDPPMKASWSPSPSMSANVGALNASKANPLKGFEAPSMGLKKGSPTLVEQKHCLTLSLDGSLENKPPSFPPPWPHMSVVELGMANQPLPAP